jgi:hypothetical protein
MKRRPMAGSSGASSIPGFLDHIWRHGILDHPLSSLRYSFGGLALKPGEASGVDGSRMMTVNFDAG